MAVALLLLGACQQRVSEQVVAKVNGTPITIADLDQAVVRLLGDQAATASPETRRKVLDTLVLHRALASKEESELVDADHKYIDSELGAYREQLLVRMYLSRHSPSRPISEAQIRDYYERNPQLFGGGTTRSFEELSLPFAQRELRAKQDGEVAVRAVSGATDWRATAKQSGMSYRVANSTEPNLPPEFAEALSKMNRVGDIQIFTANNVAYALRLQMRNTQSARPLPEVRQKISEALIALQLKQALEAVSKQILQDAHVEYSGVR